VLGFEGTDLEVESDERLEQTMVEEEVYVILFSAQSEPVLTADEAEAVTEFKEELLQSLNQPVLEFALLPGAADAEEFEVVVAFHHLVRLLRECSGKARGKLCVFFSFTARSYAPALIW
jgi:hypothetical protein